MTRKRFIKLLMSHGYSRNAANMEAYDPYYRDWSYEECWRYLKLTYYGFAILDLYKEYSSGSTGGKKELK